MPPKDPFLNATFIRVAMKLAYNGRRYNGFETCVDKNQPNSVAVEDKLFEAMEKITMIKTRKGIEKDLNYAKAGRTDAGVSSTGNVIALTVRKITGKDAGLYRGC